MKLLAPLALTLLPAALLATASPAIAAEPAQLTVKINEPSHGSVKVSGGEPCEEQECEYEFEKGTELTLLAEALGEWRFAGWLPAPCAGPDPECTFTIEEDPTEVVAVFFPILPKPPVITSPRQGQVIESAAGEVTLEFEDPELEEPEPRAVEFRCSIDSNPETTCEPRTPITYTGISEGTHSVTVFAFNEEGYPELATASFAMVIPRPPEEAPPRSQAPPLPPSPVLHAPSGVRPRLASLRARWKVRRRRTWVRKLLLGRLSAGERVAVRCSGRGRPFKKRVRRARGHRLNLTRLFRKHALRAGTVVRLWIKPPTSNFQVIELRIRAGKKPRVIRRGSRR